MTIKLKTLNAFFIEAMFQKGQEHHVIGPDQFFHVANLLRTCGIPFKSTQSSKI
ncbi:MAG: hypothetical protein V4441_02325 [Pseudomonadota bacterium]